MPSFEFWPTLIVIAAVLFVILHTVAYLILVERKVSAYMQDRIGPNRVGPFGFFQPLVDGVKMFIKEDIIPNHVDKVFYVAAPAIATATALLAFAIVPFGPTSPPPNTVPIKSDLPADDARRIANAEAEFDQQTYREHRSYAIAPGIDIGILFTFSISSLAVYGIILGGWSSNNKYSVLGALRSSAQIISYEIPLGMSILGVVLYSGSLNLEKVIDWQANHGWNILWHPLAFFIFMTSVFAECNRLPFDLPEAEQELVGGYHTEYSSIKFGLFFLGEYTHMITTSFLMAVVFFGGWHLPFGLTDGNAWWQQVLKFAAVGGKAGFFILLYIVVRWTLPRFRFDQLMSIAWKVMIPLAMVNLVLVMFVREFELPIVVISVASLGLLVGSAWLNSKRPGSPRVRIDPRMKRSLAGTVS
jgi:NADH-quinone oxidoreductase subunit H